MACTNNGILYSNKNEQTIAIYDRMDYSRKCNTELRKSELHNSIYKRSKTGKTNLGVRSQDNCYLQGEMRG